MIFESLTTLKQASKLFIYVCGKELSVLIRLFLNHLQAFNFIRIRNSCSSECEDVKIRAHFITSFLRGFIKIDSLILNTYVPKFFRRLIESYKYY